MILSPLVIDEARKRIAKTFPEHSTRFEEFLAVADYELAPVPSAEEVLGLAGEIVEYISVCGSQIERVGSPAGLADI